MVEDINGVGGVFGWLVELIIVDMEGFVLVVIDGYVLLVDVGVVGFVGGFVSDVLFVFVLKVVDDVVMEMFLVSMNLWFLDVGWVDGWKFFGWIVLSDSF